MSKFKPVIDNQISLLPPIVDDFVGETHLARVVKAIVNRLDTKKIEATYSFRGQKSYPPKLIISLLIYGYAIGVTSGRKIAKKCEEDLAFMFLANMYKPDFRTINDFRKDNLESFTQYFVDVLKICSELEMVKVGTIAIDGMKSRANASPKRSKTKEDYEKWLFKLKQQVQELLEQVEKQDEKEDKELGEKRVDELPKKLKKKQRLIAKIESTIEKFKEEDKKKKEVKGKKKKNGKEKVEKINLTDPDAKFIKDKGVFNTNYSGQIAVTADGIITGRTVTDCPKEDSELIGLIEQTEKYSGEKVQTTLADAGFSSFRNYEWLEKQNIDCYLPDQEFSNSQKKNKKNKPTKQVYPKSKFIYDKEADEYTCLNNKKVKRTRYTDKQKDRKYNVYKCTDCEGCPLKEKCTKAEFREIKRELREDIKDRAVAKLKTEAGQKKYRERAWMVESKFGHFKFNLGYTMFKLRSLKKVAAEFDLICLANNVLKIYQKKVISVQMLP